jgi:hypothetical protein
MYACMYFCLFIVYFFVISSFMYHTLPQPLIITINIKDWTLWSVPPPGLQLFSPTFLGSSNWQLLIHSVILYRLYWPAVDSCRSTDHIASLQPSWRKLISAPRASNLCTIFLFMTAICRRLLHIMSCVLLSLQIAFIILILEKNYRNFSSPTLTSTSWKLQP